MATRAMEKNKNNETQNRREFFKEAAKKALPIIGAVALMSNPVIAKAVESEPLGCNYNCSGGCNSCRGTCEYICQDDCSGSCKGGCKKSCRNSCPNSCRNSCDGSCKYSSNRR